MILTRIYMTVCGPHAIREERSRQSVDYDTQEVYFLAKAQGRLSLVRTHTMYITVRRVAACSGGVDHEKNLVNLRGGVDANQSSQTRAEYPSLCYVLPPNAGWCKLTAPNRFSVQCPRRF